MPVIHIDNENYEKEVVNRSGRILLDFWADWCGHCKMQASILDELAKEKPDLEIGKVDITAERELAERFEITSIPTLAVMENGRLVKMEEGVKTKPELLMWLG